MKLLIHSQTPTVQPLKFRNGYVISPRTALDMWILINAELIHVNFICSLLSYSINFSSVSLSHICRTGAIGSTAIKHYCDATINGRDGVSNHQPHDCLLNVHSGTDQRKLQSSTSLAIVRGSHRWPVNSPHKGPVPRRKMFPFGDVIMIRVGYALSYVLVVSQRHLKWPTKYRDIRHFECKIEIITLLTRLTNSQHAY